MSVANLLRRVVRRAAALPVRLLAADDRAAVLESLTETSIAETAIGPDVLKFYAPSPLLRMRAAGLTTKEPDTVAWLNGLGQDDVLWDIGANVGVFTMYAAAARGARVLAFEPSAPNFFVLTRNLQLNGLSERVTAYCLAVAERTELATINLDSADLGAAMSQFGAAGDTSRYSDAALPLTHGMAGVSIDDLIERFGAPRPTAIKIDVDGLEWPILRGGERTLALAGMRSVLVELSVTRHAERNQAIQWLRERGLMLASTGAPQGSGGEQAANHLFVRRP
jgi:FkbM family methyltransferase